MAAPASLPANASQAQALAYLQANFKNVYHNTAKTPYEGKNASQIYAYLSARNPGASPHDLAVATADLLLSSAVGSTVGAAASTAGAAVGDAAAGISQASFLPSWADGLAGLLSALTARNLWIRAAKVVIGGALVLVAFAHMTGADNAIAATARKAPLPV